MNKDTHKPEQLSAALDLIYQYQRKRFEKTYSDYNGIDDVKDLFFNVIYPPPETQKKLKSRNRAFARAVNSWYLKLFLHPRALKALQGVIELNDSIETTNRKMAEILLKEGPLPDCIDDQSYNALARAASSSREYKHRLRLVLDAFLLCSMVVKQSRMNLDDIIRRIPKPLIHNSELLELSINTFKTFKNHKENLDSYMKVLEERELLHINKIFGDDC